MKQFNGDSKQCRKTTLAPTFGGPPIRLIPIQHEGRISHYAYSCESQVIGIGTFPLLGDPTQVMGLNAHPGSISALSVSYDGKYIFSCGGNDLSAFMFELNLSNQGVDNAIENNEISDDGQTDDNSAKSYVSKPHDPSLFLGLLEGGDGGEMHEDIVDYFHYCQLRTQGEDAMDIRSAAGKVLEAKLYIMFSFCIQ